MLIYTFSFLFRIHVVRVSDKNDVRAPHHRYLRRISDLAFEPDPGH
jgi:hypothetical protein